MRSKLHHYVVPDASAFAERLARPVYATDTRTVLGEAHRLDRGLWAGNASDWPYDSPQFVGATFAEVSDALRLAVYARSVLSSEVSA